MDIFKLKGHWASITSSPNFKKKKKKNWDFYPIRSGGMGNDFMLNFTILIDVLTFEEI